MEERPEHEQESAGPESAADLGRQYQRVLGAGEWQLDVEPAGEDAVPAEDRESDLLAEHAQPAAPATEVAAPPPLPRILEAFLFIAGAPLTAGRAAEVIPGLTPGQFQEAIAGLNRDYRRQGRPYTIQAREQGHLLTLRPKFQHVTEKLFGTTREARLSPAAIDVLALVAYRQPVSKREIDSLRGAESGAILRQLIRRCLIAVVQRGEAASREAAYSTTPRFLELFGLSNLEDLPQTQDLQQM